MPDSRVDELRQRLRALGYLDAGVDRFVLGPARGARRPAVIALLASLRIGLIAALLLGPSAAIGVGGRMPGLITGPRDASVVAVYMGILFGAAVAAAALVASLLVAAAAGHRLAGRARALSRGAGLVVAIACLVYLTLWWRTASMGWSAPVWTAFALAVAAAISVLLGHAVNVTAFAVMMAGRTGLTPQTARSTSWRMSFAAGLIAFAGAAALLLITARASGGGGDAPPLTVVPSGLRVELVAIDGFDPVIFEQLASAGRVPSLARLARGATARMSSPPATDPARDWTTIATGQPPERHGVHELETRRVAGVQGSVGSVGPSRIGRALRDATDLLRLTRPSVASLTERREKTMWEVAEDAGLRTAVIDWWATWPAESTGGTRGIVLSDRATLRLERGGPLDAEIAPASLYDRLRSEWPGVQAESASEVAQWLSGLPSSEADVRAVLQRSAEIDAIQLALARRVSTPPPDLLAIYLPGLDIAQHALLGAGTLPPSVMAGRLDALRSYYVFLDRLLAFLAAPAPDLLAAIVTQPGRVGTPADGMLALSGPHTAAGVRVDARPTDVMPTVLHALGVPISLDLAGAPLVNVFSGEFRAKYPVREVATYGRPSTITLSRTGQPLDQEMIDRLRSLGYIR